jgi:hypothetical protein
VERLLHDVVTCPGAVLNKIYSSNVHLLVLSLNSSGLIHNKMFQEEYDVIVVGVDMLF